MPTYCNKVQYEETTIPMEAVIDFRLKAPYVNTCICQLPKLEGKSFENPIKRVKSRANLAALSASKFSVRGAHSIQGFKGAVAC